MGPAADKFLQVFELKLEIGIFQAAKWSNIVRAFHSIRNNNNLLLFPLV